MARRSGCIRESASTSFALFLPLAQIDSLFDVLGLLFLVAVSAVFAYYDRRKRQARRMRYADRHGAPPVGVLDRAPILEFAKGMGFTVPPGRPFRIEGAHGGFPLRIEYLRRIGAATRIRVVLPRPVPGRLRVRSGPYRESNMFLRPTGDPSFDAEYRVTCLAPGLATKLLDADARAWLLALGAAEVSVSKRQVVVSLPGFERDLDRLRGLLEAAVALARAAGGT